MRVEDLKEISDILSASYLFFTEETEEMKDCEKKFKECIHFLKEKLDEKQDNLLAMIENVYEDGTCAAMRFAFIQGMKVNNEIEKIYQNPIKLCNDIYEYTKSTKASYEINPHYNVD